MSWEEFRNDAKRFVNRAANKINQTADLAGLQLKLSSAEHRLSEAYEALGEAAYRHFSTENADSAPVMKAIRTVDDENPRRFRTPLRKPLCQNCHRA